MLNYTLNITQANKLLSTDIFTQNYQSFLNPDNIHTFYYDTQMSQFQEVNERFGFASNEQMLAFNNYTQSAITTFLQAGGEYN